MPDANLPAGRSPTLGLDPDRDNPAPRDGLGAVLGRRAGRRAALCGLLGGPADGDRGAAPPSPPPGEARPLLRPGDPLRAGGTRLGHVTAGLDLLSLGPDDALLVAHHGPASPDQILPGLPAGPADDPAGPPATPARARAALAAQGISVVALRRDAAGWRATPGAAANRRVRGETPIRLSGPAAGHPRLRTAADPAGRSVLGTLGNRACGVTPWGTVLSGEADFAGFFGAAPTGRGAGRGCGAACLRRDGLGRGAHFPWTRALGRFDGALTRHEPNRFGWMVELDPRDPDAAPVKRTALGRFRHAGCAHAATPDGRAVLYMTDAGRDEYLYRFVAAPPRDDAAAGGPVPPLDDGALSVARFGDDGRVQWLALRHGQGPLVAAHGFRDQADVLIGTRRAADLLEPTPIERAGPLRAVREGLHLVLPAGPPRPGFAPATDRVVAIAPPPLRQGDLATVRVDHGADEARWDVLEAPPPPAGAWLDGPGGERHVFLADGADGSARAGSGVLVRRVAAPRR